jgi:hypothetical protein
LNIWMLRRTAAVEKFAIATVLVDEMDSGRAVDVLGEGAFQLERVALATGWPSVFVSLLNGNEVCAIRPGVWPFYPAATRALETDLRVMLTQRNRRILLGQRRIEAVRGN